MLSMINYGLNQDKLTYISMRAYAIVKKPQPGLHEQEHVIKVTRGEPKISINPISENRYVSPHKAVANNIHELSNSGAYFRYNSNQQDEHSNKSDSKHQEPPKL
jgi:hypothetical protein